MVCPSFIRVSTVYSRLLSSFLGLLFLAPVVSRSLALIRSLSPRFSFNAPTSSWLILWFISLGGSLYPLRVLLPSSLVCGSLSTTAVARTGPPAPPSSSLLPSPLLRVGVPLLPSYFFSNLPALSSGGGGGVFLLGTLAPSGLISAALAFSLSVNIRIACASSYFMGIQRLMLGFSR